ncbi:hypothetical protein BN1723_014972 [Verticillium longisporum]|uniref:Uncharacterized protein n=1 Tax=Verticillium longisporum TaxID=100787 RepID=A0A0G4MM29_VERLO|nr:hypothetical protein BN1723_014972 [Verticillium longisporum]
MPPSLTIPWHPGSTLVVAANGCCVDSQDTSEAFKLVWNTTRKLALLDLVGFEFIRDEVEPGSHTVASSSDLQLNHRRRLLVIGPAQFLPYDFRRAHDIVEVNRLQPLGLLISELASLDLLCKSISPSLGVVIWSPPRSADELLSNGAIPNVMQVELLSLPQHVDTITSPRDVFIMQRLVDVTDEMHDEAGRLVTLPCAQLRIQRPLRVVGKCRYNTAFFLAVAVELDAAV